MGDGYMCGRNVKMKESLSHFCGISFLPKWDFFFAAYKMIQIKHVSKICVICVIRVPIKNKFSVVHVRWHRHQPMLPLRLQIPN